MNRRSRTRSNGKFKDACDVGFEGARRLEKMPIREFKCPDCGIVEEKYVSMNPTEREANPQCTQHNDNELHIMQRIEFSVPAKRNPRYGEQT